MVCEYSVTSQTIKGVPCCTVGNSNWHVSAAYAKIRTVVCVNRSYLEARSQNCEERLQDSPCVCMCVCVCVCVCARARSSIWNNSATTEQIFMESDI